MRSTLIYMDLIKEQNRIWTRNMIVWLFMHFLFYSYKEGINFCRSILGDAQARPAI